MSVTPTPGFTALPAAPQRLTDTPAQFVSKADAFVAALSTAGAEINAIGEAAEANAEAAEAAAVAADSSADAAVAATTLVATSTSSLAISAAAKSVAWAETGRTFANGMQAALIKLGDPSQRMWGALSSVDNTAKMATLTVSSGNFAGTGTHSDWLLVVGALEALAEATTAQVWEKAAHVALSPDVARDANAAQTLTMGATVTPNGDGGLRRSLACNGSFTLAAPTNCDPGDVFEIDITHSASSSVMTVNSALKRQNGLGVLSTTNGHRDLLIILVQAVDGSRTCTRGIYQVIRNPT